MENVCDTGPTFVCTLEEFKRRVARFSEASKTLNGDELENGFKAVSLSYLGLPVDLLTLTLARGYLDWAAKHYNQRNLALIFAKN